MLVTNALGGQEVWIIVGVIVLLFGAKKVPEMMRGIGEGMREFKKASREITEENKDSGTAAENKG
ncbi:MAG: twin-arginine translocase TatA/TatE family subunit [Armatimonadota bacterium]|jgi:sec-independent protein translocase protein TatA